MAQKAFQVNPDLETELGDQNPMGRFGRPDELRGVTLWLASDASTFCTGSEYAFHRLVSKLWLITIIPALKSMVDNALGK